MRQPPAQPIFSREEEVESGKFPLSTHEISPKLSAKRSPKLELALQWFTDHPGSVLSNREIAKELGISHAWVNQAKKEIAGDT